MPQRLHVCATPGCPTLTTTTRCPTHTRITRATQARQRRAAGDDAMTVYNTTAWRRTRKRFLTQHPNCAHCGQPAQHVDHTIPRQILTAAGIHNPDTPTWLQPLCHACHSHKTATVDTPLLARLRAGEPPDHLATQALNQHAE